MYIKSYKIKNLKSKIILQVHDELLIEAVEEEKRTSGKYIKTRNGKCYKIKSTIKIDIEEGNNLYDAK